MVFTKYEEGTWMFFYYISKRSMTKNVKNPQYTIHVYEHKIIVI